MKLVRRGFGCLILFGVLGGTAATTACADHRYYDPYYNDYHAWGPAERGYYQGWYGTAYPNQQYREYRRLNRDEQKQYWNYRHQQGGHDRDDHRHDDRGHDKH